MLRLSPAQLRQLASGESVLAGELAELQLWVAVPAVAADGSTRQVVATADLVGAVTLLGRAAIAFVIAAALASGVVALAAWIATRASLRPVDRMRLAAAALPQGERLPVPSRPRRAARAGRGDQPVAGPAGRRGGPAGALHRRRGARDAFPGGRDPGPGRGRGGASGPRAVRGDVACGGGRVDPAEQPAVRSARADQGGLHPAAPGAGGRPGRGGRRGGRPVLGGGRGPPGGAAGRADSGAGRRHAVGGGAGAGQPDRQRDCGTPARWCGWRCCPPGSGCG